MDRASCPVLFFRNSDRNENHIDSRLVVAFDDPYGITPAAPAIMGDAAAGKAKAQAMRQTCHGMDGVATIPMAANLSGQQEDYLIAQLKAYRKGKRQHEQMSIIAGSLSDAEIANLAAWYSQIKVTVEMPE
jgi:cytochrome c553